MYKCYLFNKIKFKLMSVLKHIVLNEKKRNIDTLQVVAATSSFYLHNHSRINLEKRSVSKVVDYIILSK